MNAKQIIEDIAKSKDYKNLCKNITRGNILWEDLFQELIIILCEYDPLKIEALHENGGLKFFIVRILQNQYRSDHSPFHKTHVKFKQSSTELDGIERQVETVTQDQHYASIVEYECQRTVFKNSRDWYQNNLFKGLLKEGSLTKLSTKTGISRSAITRAVYEYIDKLKLKAEERRIFMESEYLRLPVPAGLRERLFHASLYKDIPIEAVVLQQLTKINRFTIKQAKTQPVQLQLFN